MRIKDESKKQIKKEIYEFLKEANDYLNLSEIAKGVDKSPPTILKYIEELETEGKLDVLNKKSMKLIKIKGDDF